MPHVMKPMTTRGFVFFSLLGMGVGCASQPTPKTDSVLPAISSHHSAANSPEQPAPNASVSASAANAEPAEPAPPEVPAPSTSAANAEPAEPEPVPTPAPKFSALSILTNPGTAFLVDYGHSSAKERAESLCSNQVKASDADTQSKLTDCLAKERAKFTADVLRFRRDERGNGTVTVYRRTGSALPEVYVARVEYKEADNNTVQVIVKRGLSGTRPICRDRTDFSVKVPNGYSIELEDSVYGKLTYDAKVGMVGN